GFSWIPSSDSGLFNGLRAVQPELFFWRPFHPGRKLRPPPRSIGRGGGWDGIDGTGQLSALLRDGDRTKIEYSREFGERLLDFLRGPAEPRRPGHRAWRCALRQALALLARVELLILNDRGRRLDAADGDQSRPLCGELFAYDENAQTFSYENP